MVIESPSPWSSGTVPHTSCSARASAMCSAWSCTSASDDACRRVRKATSRPRAWWRARGRSPRGCGHGPRVARGSPVSCLVHPLPPSQPSSESRIGPAGQLGGQEWRCACQSGRAPMTRSVYSAAPRLDRPVMLSARPPQSPLALATGVVMDLGTFDQPLGQGPRHAPRLLREARLHRLPRCQRSQVPDPAQRRVHARALRGHVRGQHPDLQSRLGS